jgi:hypothetical protein
MIVERGMREKKLVVVNKIWMLVDIEDKFRGRGARRIDKYWY